MSFYKTLKSCELRSPKLVKVKNRLTSAEIWIFKLLLYYADQECTNKSYHFITTLLVSYSFKKNFTQKQI